MARELSFSILRLFSASFDTPFLIAIAAQAKLAGRIEKWLKKQPRRCSRSAYAT